MRRIALLALLALVETANAALPRVAIDAPLAPISAPASAAHSLSAAPSLFLSLAAPSIIPAPPMLSPALASPAPLAMAAAPAALAAPRLEAPSVVEPAGPKAIDALNANAPLADKLSSSGGSSEGFAQSLGAGFDGAAPLGPLAGEAAAPADSAHDPLLARLRKTVRFDDGGVPERQAALTKSFQSMLRTPTARAFAERFIEDGVPAVVRFEEFEGSRIHESNGRRIFLAPRAFTRWKDDHVEVRLNLDYLRADEEFQEQDLPPTLAHELFGHGLWYSRAVRENLFLAFHHHELNETNARLVGWLVDFELDHRFEEGGAWSYLSDPAALMAYLKLRLPYYALTWSTAELARPRETLEERSLAAQAKREQLRSTLANHLSWNGVIDHFASHHEVAETRLRSLRAYMAETTKGYEDEISIMNALITEVDAMAGRMKAEPDHASEKYLQQAATHPFFADLRRETDANTSRLMEQVSRTPAKPGDESEATLKAREDHWRGQITFEELVEMYRKDRERHPDHWQGG